MYCNWVFEHVEEGSTHPPMKSLIPCNSKECQRRLRLKFVIYKSTISIIVSSEYCWFSHLQLLRVFLLPQFEAELVGGALQPADLLRGLSECLLQLLELLLFLLLQFALDALLLLQQEIPQTAELCWDQLLQITGLLLDNKVVTTIQLKGFFSVVFCFYAHKPLLYYLFRMWLSLFLPTYRWECNEMQQTTVDEWVDVGWWSERLLAQTGCHASIGLTPAAVARHVAHRHQCEQVIALMKSTLGILKSAV